MITAGFYRQQKLPTKIYSNQNLIYLVNVLHVLVGDKNISTAEIVNNYSRIMIIVNT